MRSARSKYFTASKKAYYSVFFILPFLIAYEVGLFQGALGGQVNGADAILRMLFYFLNSFFGSLIAQIVLGVVIAALILYLAYSFVKDRERIRLRYILYMLIESAILGFIVGTVIHLLLNHRFPRFFTLNPNSGVVGQLAVIGLNTPWSKIVASIGAGVFEELVFRVITIRLLYMFFKGSMYRVFGSDKSAVVKAVLLSSVIFSLMHLTSVGNLFGLVSIFFGSIIFSAIYLKRGYGIVAATHIFYDVYLMFGILA